MTSPRARTVLLGLDAADRVFVERHRAALPTLDACFRSAPPVSLETPCGDLPGAVWPTFYTGSSPGDHGIYHHIQWDADRSRMRRVADDWLHAEPFWYDLVRAGRAVCATDVPMTFPSRQPGGLEVINWGSHDQLGPFHANDRDWERRLGREFGRHPMGAEIPVNKTAAQLATIHQALVTGAARKTELLLRLLDHDPWDLFIAVYGETHRGGHILWPEAGMEDLLPRDALLDVYRAVDDGLGRILERLDLDRDRVLLFALHGMEDNRSQEHLVPRLIDLANAAFNGAEAPAEAADGGGLMRTLRERVPAGLQHAIAQRVPVAVRDWVVSRAVDGGHDWDRTPGLALLADLNAYLRFNVRGRERHGSLDADSENFVAYRTLLENAFAGLADADGEPLVDEVVRTPERYPGRRSHRLPDLLVRWSGAPPSRAATAPALGTVNGELATGRGGNHRPEGFLCALGAGMQGRDLPGRVQDLAAFTRALVGAAP